MASADKVTLLDQIKDTATRIKQYILQQISDLADAVQAAIPETYAGSAEAGGVANKTAAIPYGHVDSTSTATAYTATIDGITELVDGTTVLLKNGVVTSQSGFTININGLGAKPVYNSMAAASAETTIFNAAYTLLLVYDSTRVSGGCWINYRGYYSDSNTVPTGYCTTAAATAAKAATCNYGYRDDDTYFPCLFRYANTAANATLAISSYATTAAPIYVNGARTSASNTFGRGVILFLYHDGAYYTYNDGRFPIVVDGAVTSVQEYVASKYTKPTDGIPYGDITTNYASEGQILTLQPTDNNQMAWMPDDLSHALNDTPADYCVITKTEGQYVIDVSAATISERFQSSRKLLFIFVQNGTVYNYWPYYFNSASGTLRLMLISSDTITTIEFSPDPETTFMVATEADVTQTTISGGSSLPSVTTSDNGKVLMVVNGAWAAGSIPSATGVSF